MYTGLQLTKKINLLIGEWNTADVAGYCLPILSKLQQIDSFYEKTISLTHLTDESFWLNLSTVHKFFIANMDYRHWYYDDSVFETYVKKLALCKFPAISLFQAPFGYEMPKMDLSVFEKKLFQRTKVLHNIVKNESRKTIILSPQIYNVDQSVKNNYLDYFIHNRQMFDCYALNCCCDMKDNKLAALHSLLAELLRIQPKEVWVVRWSVPAFDRMIESNVLAAGWQPLKYSHAASHLRTMFSTVETIAQNRTKWFFSGIAVDKYHPDKKKPEPYWEKSCHVFSDSLVWDYSDFLGTCTHDGTIKTEILDALLSLV